MKKLFAILTAIALTVCLAGCGAQIDVKVDDPEGLVSTIISNLPESSEITSSETDTGSNVTSEPTSSEEASTPSTPSTPSSPSSTIKPSSTPSTPLAPSTPSSPSSTIKPSTTPSAPAKNEFVSSNNSVSPGDLAIRPKYVYWDGNTLVAECYIVNGLSRPVRNINVYNITFKNRTQQIASAEFGECNGLVVQPNQSVVWTFKFGADCIQSMGADITYLECDAGANYIY